jgi:hypothetical protein
VRYHLNEWRGVGIKPASPDEVFNYYHSSLRSVVECAFGRLKRVWKILRATAPEYSLG